MQNSEQDLITLDDDGDVQLPVVELLTGRGFITGKSGSGKSNTASVVVEELLDRGFPVLIVDTDGEYWGLKEEYEILHVGADEECDLQVGPEHAEKLATLALEENVPIILDVSGYLDQDQANALVRETASSLFAKEKKLNKPFLMLLEECHEYIPESSGLDETGEMLIRVAKRGRKRGLGIVGLSQRPADVKKDFITQCDWLLWHRLTWQNDTKVVRNVVGSEYADAVQELDDGEGFLMADFMDEDVQRVRVRRKRTFDAGATPDLGEFERPDLKSVSGDLVGELEEISEQEEKRQDRIAQLEEENDQLRETIDNLQDELDQARDMTDMAEQFSQALMSSAGGGEGGEALQEKIDEIREEKNARIAELEQENEGLRDELRELRDEKADLSERVEALEEYEQAVQNMDELREAVGRMNEALGIDEGGDAEKWRQKYQEEREKREKVEKQSVDVEAPSDYADFVEDEVVRDALAEAKEEGVPRYVKAIVAAILQNEGPATQGQIADDLDISDDSNVLTSARVLEELGVITMEGRGRDRQFDFDVENVTEIKRELKRRERLEDAMEDL